LKSSYGLGKKLGMPPLTGLLDLRDSWAGAPGIFLESWGILVLEIFSGHLEGILASGASKHLGWQEKAYYS